MTDDEDNRARLDHAINFARDGLKALLIINGGAIIGLFTLVGAISGSDGEVVSVHGPPLQAAFVAFGIGTASAVAATLCAYLSQDWFFMSQDRLTLNLRAGGSLDTATPKRCGERARLAGILSAAVSLLSFLVGATCALFGVLPAA